VARPPSRSIHVATPERLLDAAEAEFAARGYAACRLEDVAARAGITRPSLLHHYATKDALYAAVVARAFGALGAGLHGAMARDRAFLETLDALIDAFVGFVEARPAVAALIVRELLDRNGPGSRILLEQVSPLLDRVELFIRTKGAGARRSDVPLRAALVHTCAGVLLRAAAGPLAAPLWGPGQHSRRLARRLLAGEARAAGGRR
jgi:AcrR family transcriptional regulator